MSEPTGPDRAGGLKRRMRGRDPGEQHRAASVLELFFDLTFVAAIAQAAAQLHHAITAGHVASGLAGYAAVFFAIWWAWMNFTWFSSAYDTDDVPYRLLTLLQMGGVLVLAAGVPAAMSSFDFTTVTLGYVIMRLAMIAQWLRAAAEHPAGRAVCLRYATGIGLVQLGWIARLWAPGVWTFITFGLLVLAELAVPAWAEHHGRATPWHPGHIAERYGLLTIITLGEVILAALAGVSAALSARGLTAPVLLIAAGGLVLVFALWWIYFTGADAALATLRTALTWGFGHYLIFAAIAAIGAGLEVALAVATGHTPIAARTAALAIAVPVVVFLLVLASLHRLVATGAVGHPLLVTAGALVVLGLAFSTPVFGLGGAVLGMGLATAATLAANLVTTHRRRQRASHTTAGA